MRKRSGFGWVELISGVGMLLLGIFTILRPQSMFTGLAAIYGLLAIVTGVCDIVFYIKAERYIGFGPGLSLISGILSVVAGAALLAHPGIGTAMISLLFPLWFIAHCVSHLTHWKTICYVAGRGCCYISLVMNILGLVLGILLLAQPTLSLAVAGTLVGVYLIASGVEMIALALGKMGSIW